jgi:hypothetical protein
MIDATGMCGGCRVEVGGETKYTCVDGPEFDGHEVDFDLLMKRLQAYIPEESIAMNPEKHAITGGPVKIIPVNKVSGGELKIPSTPAPTDIERRLNK